MFWTHFHLESISCAFLREEINDLAVPCVCWYVAGALEGCFWRGNIGVKKIWIKKEREKNEFTTHSVIRYTDGIAQQAEPQYYLSGPACIMLISFHVFKCSLYDRK